MIATWFSRLLRSEKQPVVPTPRMRLQLEWLEDRLVPATLFVDPRLPDGPDGTVVTFNDGRPSAVPNLSLNTTAFNSFINALALAQNGDTIRLSDDTITTGVVTVIDRSVTIVGSGAGVTVLNPEESTPTLTGTTSGWFVIQGGATVNFQSLTVDGLAGTFDISQAIRYDNGNGTIDSVAFQNIDFSPGTLQYFGIAVTALGGGLVTVANSTFTNMGRSGVVVSGDTASALIANNTYIGKGAGDNLDVAFDVNFGASATITGNTIFNGMGIAQNSAGEESAAILVGDPGTSATIIGNTIRNNRIGVAVGLADNDTPAVTINFNNIFNNETGLATSVATTSPVDAQFNFWGASTGPTDPRNPSGLGDSIEDSNAASASVLDSFLRKTTPVVAGATVQDYIAAATPPSIVAFGAGGGGGPRVVVQQNGQVVADFFAFIPSFTGGVNVAVGDVNGDGRQDVVVAALAGGGPNVKVFDALTGQELSSFFAYASTFSGGVSIAVADVTGDGIDDIVTGAGPGGGPHVKVFNISGQELQSFFAYDPAVTGGVNVAAGDISGDFVSEIVTSVATNAAPHVKVFDINVNLLQSFFAYDVNYTGGVFVALGDFNGDFRADIATGTNFGAAHVRLFSGLNPANELQSFFAQDPTTFFGGVRVGATDVLGVGRDNLVLAAGIGSTPNVTGSDLTTGQNVLNVTPFNTDFLGGVFVA